MQKDRNLKLITINERHFHISRISKCQMGSLTDLFNTARNRKLPYSFFQKKYDTAWAGLENIAIVILDDQEKVIAHLGVLPTPIILDGKKYMSGQISDAVLDPILRGKKVFDLIIKELESLAKTEGIDFLWVAPSPQAIKGFESNNWLERNYLKSYSIPVRTIPLNKIANKFHLDKLYRFYIRLGTYIFTKKKKSLLNPNISDDCGGVEISEIYVSHKNYTYNYITKRNGFTFWFKIEDGMEIGNIEYFPSDEQIEFERTIIPLAQILGCHQIKIITTKDTFQDRSFTNYPVVNGNKIYFKELNVSIDFTKIRFNGSDLNTF